VKDKKFHIDFMLDCVKKIENSIQGISKEMFLENQEKQSTVILQWKQIIGFRDIAIHDYVNLDLDRVWDSAQKDIPPSFYIAPNGIWNDVHYVRLLCAVY